MTTDPQLLEGQQISSMPRMTLAIPYCIPSQNTRDSWHWSKRSRDTKAAESMLRALYSGSIAHNGTKRAVGITSYRKRLCTDDANLRGGAKGLVDALKRAGALVDDSDTWATITYAQAVLSAMPSELVAQFGRRAVTVIELAEVP